MGGQSISRTGRGLIETEVLLWGKEGLIASGALLMWALVIGYALWLVLPLTDRPASTNRKTISWTGSFTRNFGRLSAPSAKAAGVISTDFS